MQCQRRLVLNATTTGMRLPLGAVRSVRNVACRAAPMRNQQHRLATTSKATISSEQPAPFQRQHQQPAAPAAAVAALSSLLLGAGAAIAGDDEPVYAYPATDDPVITVMFTLAIGLLSVVTLGVRRCVGLGAGG